MQEIWGDGCLLGQLTGTCGVSLSRPLFLGCRRMHSFSADVARPWYIAIVCSVGEERMSPYVGALCLACGRSRWKQTLTDSWLANGTWNDRLRGGRILLYSAICVAGSRAMSPHVVDLAGCCLHVPRHSPPPPRLLRLFRHRSLGCACVCGGGGASPSVANRSSPGCQSLTTRITFRPDFSLCGS